MNKILKEKRRLGSDYIADYPFRFWWWGVKIWWKCKVNEYRSKRIKQEKQDFKSSAYDLFYNSLPKELREPLAVFFITKKNETDD